MERSINGDRIKQLRIRKSWSQEKLAAASGLSLRTIQRIENERVCSLESRQAIATTLQVEPDMLDNVPQKLIFTNQDLSDAKFDDINLSNAGFSDTNLSNTTFEDINLAKAEFTNSNLRKAKFVNINLSNTLFDDVNLREVIIVDANIRGMKVNGYLVADLIEHYENTRPDLLRS